MSEIREDSALQSVVENAPLQGLNRVLHVNPEIDLIVTIAISKKPDAWLCRSSLATIQEAFDAHLLAPAIVVTPALQISSDKDIHKEYPDLVVTNMPPESPPPLPPPLAVRENRLALIHPIIYENENENENENERTKRARGELFSRGFIANAIANIIKEKGSGIKSQIYVCLKHYFMGGCNEQGLMARRENCGAPGVEKQQTEKLGRHNALTTADYREKIGIPISEYDKETMSFFWKRTHANGKDVAGRFLEYSQVFHHKEIRIEAGSTTVILKEPHEMPTLAQFKRWGPYEDNTLAPWRSKLIGKEYLLEHRVATGSARDGIFKVGPVAGTDATPTDVNLVRIESRLAVAGVANRIVIHDLAFDLVLGVHTFFGAATTKEALVALFIAASPKDKIAEWLRMPKLADGFPAYMPRELLGDHGELFSDDATDAADAVNCNLTFPEALRGEMKGATESEHQATHKKLDHHLEGTNHGRQKKRGEGDPRIPACLNLYEYTALLWDHYHHKNCVELVPELLTLEMRRDNVQPTRMEMYRWCQKNGYTSCAEADPQKLIAFMLPRFRAHVTPEGIFLLRPNCGRKPEFIRHACYVGPFMAEAGWLGGFNQKTFEIELRIYPNHPRVAYYIHPRLGMQVFTLKSRDPLMDRIASIDDMLLVEQGDRITRLVGAGAAMQADSDQAVMRQDVQDAAVEAKRKELDALDKKPTKASLKKDVKANKDAEKEAMADNPHPGHPLASQLPVAGNDPSSVVPTVVAPPIPVPPPKLQNPLAARMAEATLVKTNEADN